MVDFVITISVHYRQARMTAVGKSCSSEMKVLRGQRGRWESCEEGDADPHTRGSLTAELQNQIHELKNRMIIAKLHALSSP